MRTSGHTLDWEIKPSPFKIYPDLAPAPLGRELPALGTDVLRALSGEPPGRAERLDRSRLAALLHFSAGITRHRVYPGGGEVFFRAAPSTGALYQTEVYVVAGAVDGLEAGVYHFSPGDFALRPLRAGADFRAVLAVAAADDAVAAAPATLIASAIYWRNTWKYRARGYRHLFWDAGSLLANLLAAVDLSVAGIDEIVVTGDRPDLLAVVHSTWRPRAVLVWGERTPSPLWEGRDEQGPAGRAYVCRGNVCDAPASTPDELRDRLTRS